MNYTEEELEQIYQEAKEGIITRKELIPFKDFIKKVVSIYGFEFYYSFPDFLELLFQIQKEKKLEFLEDDFLEFVRKNPDSFYFNSILEGLTFENTRLQNNLEKNEDKIRTLCACFSGIFDILSEDITAVSYLLENNPYFANLSIRYTSFRISILNDESIELNNRFVLVNVLDLMTVYMYLNKESFQEKEELLDKSILNVKENILLYRDYFKENKIFDEDSSLGPVSSSGFLQEFLVMGEIVKSIYEKENNLKRKK